MGQQRRWREPDVVLACAGDVPTLETVAAAAIPRERLPDLKVRLINVVDLMRLQDRDLSTRTGWPTENTRRCSRPPAGDLRLPRLSLADPSPDVPAQGGREPPRARLQGRGDDDDALRHGDAQRSHRFHLVMDVIDRVPDLGARYVQLRQEMVDTRLRYRAYTRRVGDDPSDVRDWTWPFSDGPPGARATLSSNVTTDGADGTMPRLGQAAPV